MKWEPMINDLKERFQLSLQDVNAVRPGEIYVDIRRDLLAICELAAKTYHASLVALFANDEREIHGHFLIYYTFAGEDREPLLTFRYFIAPDNPAVPSISLIVPAAILYEMEIRDLFGIRFEGHPNRERLVFHTGRLANTDGYPLRRDYPAADKTNGPPYHKKYLDIEGTGVYEIPVGPVHAGIIEPGHFRFSVAGEPIIHLEAELYYVHKGIEKLAENRDPLHVLLLAERISGDETFSNSLAFCLAVERIAGQTVISERAAGSRMIFAEMERIYNHLGDLSGICLDVAYGFAASQFAMMRRWCQMANEQLTGSRFLRNVNRPGGLRRDFLCGRESQVLELLDKLEREFLDTVKTIKKNSLYIDRVENTGIVKQEVALDLHAVGPAARSAGIPGDARRRFPYLDYQNISFEIPVHNMGDVNCRANVKIDEVFESIGIIRNIIKRLPDHGAIRVDVAALKPYRFAFGITESPRGENLHWVMSGPDNTIYRYKIRTPSFCNWPVLCQAVKGNIVPDFPLINKSFNLSYSGNDL